jgi:hypothetical protein
MDYQNYVNVNVKFLFVFSCRHYFAVTTLKFKNSFHLYYFRKINDLFGGKFKNFDMKLGGQPILILIGLT